MTHTPNPPQEAPRIEITCDGPYSVTGSVPLQEQIIVSDAAGTPVKWKPGREIEAGKNYCLCRCGHSTEQPFCSGAHVEAGFDGAEKANRKSMLEQAEKIAGPALDLVDAPHLCAGAGFCHRAEGIWELVPKSGDAKARQIAIEEAADCPSGRLVVTDKDGRSIEPEFKPSIGLVVEDPDRNLFGPLWVRGNIPVVSADGAPYEVRNRVTLCRCGRSSNKPFCDGSHAEPQG